MMKTVKATLVTIIAEDEIESRLVREILGAGARGYTISKVRGAGLHRERVNEWEGENIILRTIVNQNVAEKIMTVLSEKYFESFGMTAYLTEVDVLRAEKYL